MVYKCFDKKTKVISIKNEIKQNQQLPEELHEFIHHLNTIFGVLI